MEIKGSDISQQPILDKEQHREVYVHGHEKSDVPVKLDLFLEEAVELGKLGLKVVTIEVVDPNKPDDLPELIVTDQKALDKFGGPKVKMPEVIANATKAPKRKLGRAAAAEALNGEERDYRSIEWAGSPKKGLTSPQEQRIVQENLDQVNANLRARGQREIDLGNPDHVKRYGLERLVEARKNNQPKSEAGAASK